MQHVSSESTPREYPLTPRPRRKKLLSKEERDEHVKQSPGAHPCDDKFLDQTGEIDLKYLDVKRDILKIKQEILNQSLVINYAASSRPILNDSISKSVTLKPDNISQPIHMNDHQSKKVVIKDINDDNNISLTSDDSNSHINKSPIINHGDKLLGAQKISNRRSRWEKRPATPEPEQVRNNYMQEVYNARPSKTTKQRIGSPKHKKCTENHAELCSDEYLNDYNKRLISEGKTTFIHRSKSEDFEKHQMQTWVYNLICCQNYYSVALYLGLLILVIGIIFVAFKLYLIFILPRDKETHNTQHVSQQHWDNPNLINPLPPDYDKVANQLHGFRSDYSYLQNLSNIDPWIRKHNNPTPRRRTTERKTIRKLAINKPSNRRQYRVTEFIVKKDVVPTTSTTSTFHTWTTYASEQNAREVIPPTRYTGNNNNRYNTFKGNLVTTTVRPLTLTTSAAPYYPYPYSDGNKQKTDKIADAGWQWNGFNWVQKHEITQQRYDKPSENYVGIHKARYPENIRNKQYDESLNYVTTTPSPYRFPTYYPSNSYTANLPQTTTAYQRWWQQYYSSLSQMNEYNWPTTLPKYSTSAQPWYGANINAYQTAGWPVIDHKGYNTYGNGYQSANGYINNQGSYNSFPNIYRTTGRPINNQDVTMLMNYRNQLESNLGGYINQVHNEDLPSETSGQFSGAGVEGTGTRIVQKLGSVNAEAANTILPNKLTKKQAKHNKKKKWKKGNKKKTRTTPTTPKLTTTTLTTTPTTTSTTTPATTTSATTTTNTTTTTTKATTTTSATTTTASTTTTTVPTTTTTTKKATERTTESKVEFTNTFTNTITVPSKSTHRNTRNREHNDIRYGISDGYKGIQNNDNYIGGDGLAHNNDIHRNAFRNRYEDEDGMTEGSDNVHLADYHGMTEGRDNVHLADYHGAIFGGGNVLRNVDISRFGSDGEDNPSSVFGRDHIDHVYSDDFYTKHDDKKSYKKNRYYVEGGDSANKYSSYSRNTDNSDNGDGNATLDDDGDADEGEDDDNEENNDPHNDDDDDNSVPNRDHQGDIPDGNQRKVRVNSHKISKRLRKHKMRHNGPILDDDDESQDDNTHTSTKYKSELYLASQKHSKKHNKRAYSESMKEVHKKRKIASSKSEKSNKDHRLQLLATIQRRIEALKKLQKLQKSNEHKDDDFLEEVGHKRSEVKHVKKSCASIKTFRPGTMVRIKKGPERRHGKIIYSIRACRKMLVENDIRIKCKDIEYKISGGRLTVRGERRGRTKKFSIFACRDHNSGNTGSGDRKPDALFVMH